ncbi:molecular chaperone TorD family protein [bacterium]|nr:molecular chaperone TorD family protein [bacterium]
MTQKKAEEAKKIGAIYKLLSRVFISEVDARFLGQLRTPCYVESLKSAGIDFGDEFLSRNEEELLEDLAVEYTRLFIVPGSSVSLYESVYTEEMLCGESAGAVSDFYRKCGMEALDETFLPDHIGLELELMSYLKQKEAAALRNGNQDTSRWIGLQKEFLSSHLLKWAPRFFAGVLNRSEHPFYKEMARFGKQFLAIEIGEDNDQN